MFIVRRRPLGRAAEAGIHALMTGTWPCHVARGRPLTFPVMLVTVSCSRLAWAGVADIVSVTLARVGVVDGLALLGTRISAVEGLCCPEHLRNVLNVVPPPARPRVARAGSAREQFHPVPMTALRQSTVGAMALHPEWPDLPRLVYATPRE